MKVGISTATFFSKVLTEDSFSVIQRCGGDTCEVFLTTFYEYKDSFGRLLKERKGDFDVYSVHSLNTQFEPQLFNKVQRTYDDAEGVFRSVLNVGQIIGAKAYTFQDTVLCRILSIFRRVCSYAPPRISGRYTRFVSVLPEREKCMP